MRGKGKGGRQNRPRTRHYELSEGRGKEDGAGSSGMTMISNGKIETYEP